MKRTPWISWRLFFITLPVDVFAVVFLSGRTQVSLENVHYLTLLAIVAHFAMAPFLPIAIQINRRFNSWQLDLSTLFLLGTVRGFVLFLYGQHLEIPGTVIDEFRILNSAIALPTWFIFFALAIEARRQYQQEFNTIFREFAAKVEVRNQEVNSNDRNSSSTDLLIKRLQSVTSNLGNEIQQVLTQSSDKSDYAMESEKLQYLIDHEIRPASQQLWKGISFISPPINRTDLLRIALLEQKLPVKYAILMTAPLLFVGVSGAYGVRVAVIQTLTAILPILISEWIMEELYARDLLTRSKANFFVLVFGGLTPIPLQFSLVSSDDRISQSLPSFAVFQTALWIGLVTVLVGFNLFYSINKQRNVVLGILKSLLRDEKYLDFMTAEFNPVRDMELSRYLHGEIQSQLTASALLLQQASKKQDLTLAREALENAVRILSQNHIAGYERSLSSTDVHFSQIVSGWRGIADVDINLQFLSFVAESSVRDAVELIGEGVANAIRHGKASKVSVFDEKENGKIRIHVHSNAIDSPQGKAGIGTEMFNRLTLDWNFESGDGRSALTFEVLGTNQINSLRF